MHTVWQIRPEVEWEEKGIFYHSYQYGMPILSCPFPPKFQFDVLSRYWFNRQRIRKIVNRINPDFVHLFGAENQQYAQIIPELAKKYPILITIQGFLSREVGYHPDTLGFRRACESEKAALAAGSMFLGERDSIEYAGRILGRNLYSREMYFPINEKLAKEVNSRNILRKYDCVFLARICRQKGIVDFLKMVGKLREMRKGNLCAAVAGPFCEKKQFLDYCREAGCDPSWVEFKGRLPSQESVYGFLSLSRVYVIPTYNDCFPTTIRESAFLKTAVVAYATGGIPYAKGTDDARNLLLREQGDVDGLARDVDELLSNGDLRAEIVENAYGYAQRYFSLEGNVGVIRGAYGNMEAMS